MNQRSVGPAGLRLAMCWLLLWLATPLSHAANAQALKNHMQSTQAAHNQAPTAPPDRSQPPSAAVQAPVAVDVSLFLNKIYNVNTLDETYQVDGYLVAQWQNPPAGVGGAPQTHIAVGTYENAAADALLAQGLWVPALEFINVVGTPEYGNTRIEIRPSGQVIFNTRFLATFTADMDFRRFPFDHQQFVLQLEPFSYSEQVLKLRHASVSAESLSSEQPGEWQLADQAPATISSIQYSHLTDSHGQPERYSRLTVTVDAKRNPAFYLWSFLLPLSLIIAASWAVFWVDGFSDRLQTSFTMMLTVVAYAFYTSNILPRLPYTTLIEQLVIAGYCSIFVAVLLLVFVEHQQSRQRDAQWLVQRCRWAFPLCSLLVVLALACRQVLL